MSHAMANCLPNSNDIKVFRAPLSLPEQANFEGNQTIYANRPMQCEPSSPARSPPVKEGLDSGSYTPTPLTELLEEGEIVESETKTAFTIDVVSPGFGEGVQLISMRESDWDSADCDPDPLGEVGFMARSDACNQNTTFKNSSWIVDVIYLGFYKRLHEEPAMPGDQMKPFTIPQRFLILPYLPKAAASDQEPIYAHTFYLKKVGHSARPEFIYCHGKHSVRPINLECVVRLPVRKLHYSITLRDVQRAIERVEIPKGKIGYTYMTWISDVIHSLFVCRILDFPCKPKGQEILRNGMRFCRSVRENLKKEGLQDIPKEWAIQECNIRGEKVV